MKKEYVFGWGTPFTKINSQHSQAMWEMEGRCRKERWDDERYKKECQLVIDRNLPREQRDRVFD